MITRDIYKTFIYQHGNTLVAKGLEELVDKHYDMLIKLLPYPPHRSSIQLFSNFYVVHDGLGNLWIGDSGKVQNTPLFVILND